MRSHHFLYLAFFLTGIGTVSTSALVAMAGTPTRADSDIGGLIAAQFGGQLVGSFCVRWNIRFCFILGCLLTSLAATVLAWTHTLSGPLLFIFGLGLGLSMAAINTLTGRESPPELCTRRLEILNVFWPLGAAVCPWLLGHLPAGKHSPLTLCYGALALPFSLLVIRTTLRKPLPKWSASKQRAPEAELPGTYPIVLGMLALLAVGVESGVANWLPTYQQRYLPLVWLPLPLATLFWGSVIMSRLFTARWLTGRSDRAVLMTAPLAAGLAIGGLSLLKGPWLLACCTVAAASAIGPVYPLLLSWTVKLKAPGLVFFLGAVGSGLFPWLIGRAATLTHSLRFSLLVSAAGGLLLCLSTSRVSPPGRSQCD